MLHLDIGSDGDLSTKLFRGHKCCYDDQGPVLSYYFKFCLPQLTLGDHNVNKASELLLGYPCHHHNSFTIYFTLSSVLLNYYFGEVM